jgi:probable rRNA maturation factor
MAIEVAVQRATSFARLPADADFERWARAALHNRESAELTIRLVGRAESRRLNRQFRGQDADTNVLSFPADLPGDLGSDLLGDVVICAARVAEEAREQGKPESAHWAHLTIHGVLHLLGYDHERAEDAGIMENLEITLLESLGIPDPY